MNIIFLDFDGVLDTLHDFYDSNFNKVDESIFKANLEKRIKILGDICKKYDCKVVIEAAAKRFINEITLETDVDWIIEIFKLFKKYDIECIGRTPELGRTINDFTYYSIWKQDEIRLYLFRHPEIDHYVVIDDDDALLYGGKSDLEMVRKHLVKTEFYCEKSPEEEGLLEKHIDEVGEKLKEENEIKKFALKKQQQ